MNLDSKKILITGISGFIGRNLYEELLSNYDCQIFGLSLKNIVNDNRVKTYLTDVRDLEQVSKIVKEISPDIIFHFAGCDGKGDSKDFKNVNTLGTENMLKALEGINYDLFVFISTSEVYDSNETPFKEDDVNPITEYAKTKFESEKICREHIDKGRPITIIRVGVAYGPWQSKKFFIPEVIKSCLKDDTFNMTLGEQTRDFIYISDVVKALLKIPFINEARGQVINISSGKATKLRDVVDETKKLIGSDTKINYGTVPYRQNEVFNHQLDIQKAFNILKWEPQINIKEGLNKTIEWLAGEKSK